jgi:adenylate kinase
MIVALTGTPGTGKSTVSQYLRKNGYQVLDINDIVISKNFILGYDDDRETSEVDLKALNKYIHNHLASSSNVNTKSSHRPQVTAVVVLEGHIAHLLAAIDRVIVLRCHPAELEKRLIGKGWSAAKVRENLEAEAVDAITIESINNHGQDKTFEIDTSKATPKKVSDSVIEIINGKIDSYTPGKLDWSEEILKWY